MFVPVGMNPELTTPLTSQKVVIMTLPADIAVLNSFGSDDLCDMLLH
jgi:hypothetical protein